MNEYLESIMRDVEVVAKDLDIYLKERGPVDDFKEWVNHKFEPVTRNVTIGDTERHPEIGPYPGTPLRTGLGG